MQAFQQKHQNIILVCFAGINTANFILLLLLLLPGERNLVLRSDLVEGLTQCYKSVGVKLEGSKFHLVRAQMAAQVTG